MLIVYYKSLDDFCIFHQYSKYSQHVHTHDAYRKVRIFQSRSIEFSPESKNYVIPVICVSFEKFCKLMKGKLHATFDHRRSNISFPPLLKHRTLHILLRPLLNHIKAATKKIEDSHGTSFE
jgi:hypothetical protein